MTLESDKLSVRDRSQDLLAVGREFERIAAQLAQAEVLCARIGTLQPQAAEAARQSLREGRSQFAEARLRLVRALDLLDLDDQKANRVRQAVLERYRYPSAAAAGTISQLIASLAPTPKGDDSDKSATFAERLAEAMRSRGDNKKSAAGKIVIAPKTLDRLLSGQSTKPVKRAAAEKYIRDVLGED